MIQLLSSGLKVDRINTPEVTNTTFLLGSKADSFLQWEDRQSQSHNIHWETLKSSIQLVQLANTVTAVKLSGTAQKVHGRSVRTELAL